jgi:hypothetical protein
VISNAKKGDFRQEANPAGQYFLFGFSPQAESPPTIPNAKGPQYLKPFCTVQRTGMSG